MGWRERRALEYVEKNFHDFRKISKLFGEKPCTREEIYNSHVELLKFYQTEKDYETFFIQFGKPHFKKWGKK